MGVKPTRATNFTNGVSKPQPGNAAAEALLEQMGLLPGAAAAGAAHQYPAAFHQFHGVSSQALRRFTQSNDQAQ